MQSDAPRRQFARVGDLASEPYPNTGGEQSEVSDDILCRIRKCLDRANHPTTPEAEAKAALRVAHKLMQQHSVHQADVYANAVDADNTAQISGRSVVHILSNKELVIDETWTSLVVTAITVFFDCDAYCTTRRTSVDWIFYGIALNTATAAMAFEMVFNLVQEWSFQRKKGNKNSYRLGVANGLQNMAYQEKELEKQQAREKEAADLAEKENQELLHRQRELERLSRNDVAEQQQIVLNADDCVVQVINDPRLVFLCFLMLLTQLYCEDKGSGQVTQFGGLASNFGHGTEDNGDLQTGKQHQPVKIEDESEDHTHTPRNKIKISVKDKASCLKDDSDANDIIRESRFWTFNEDDEDHYLDSHVDFEDQVQQHMPSKPNTRDYPPQPTKASSKQPLTKSPDFSSRKGDEQTATWKSVSALIKYQDDAQKIADDYLKDHNIVLGKGRSMDWKIRDQESYKDGKTDSQKIDVKRRRIDEAGAESNKYRVKRRRIEDKRM